ncbi:MAG: periplasmic heavy metal sensor [Pedosphaera sp.]|nr:periplasmic heavy metal sensor [Pedosphaera sp.]
MKRLWKILLCGGALGALAFVLAYRHAAHPSENHIMERAELGWLRNDFSLSETQFTEVCRLHDAYVPRCAELCRRIEAKNTEIGRLITGGNTITPELDRALTEAGQLRVECQKAMLAHFFSVSRAMPPEEGRRYLQRMFESTSLRSHHMSHE